MPTTRHPAKKMPVVGSMALGAALIFTIAVGIAVLPIPNYAFTPAVYQYKSDRTLMQINFKNDKLVTGKNFELSARDTIFSLVEEDDGNDDNIENPDIDIADLLADKEFLENNVKTDDGKDSKKKKIGDPLREDNGVRPSIHPTAINAIVDALKARAEQSKQEMDDDDDDTMHFRATETVEPLMVMVTAGQFASDAIQKRQESSEADGMLMTQDEEQTLAGRIMGVIMRLDALEEELAERVSGVEWIGKYDEWGNFGVLSDEHQNNLARDSDSGDDGLADVHAKILDDPLFCMNRAECLLAIFLQEVEIPQLEKLKETVPDGSKIDFLDQDRLEVVVGSDKS
ncbi:unnamed protein product [Pseudo-nitzschia multistriata]|uniref:Uncharacterized protein n=1 Tax=Pseudo-nitzschia multistriata TaxID=183589 RepID=A0A448Z5R5_9STRA|nr:unnamed protein product [Pseudo-nitzschia multistriata]